MVALTRTCKKLSNLYQELVNTCWDVDTDIRRFVESPLKFREQLGQYDAFVSGTFASQFFERAWKEPEMIIFIKLGGMTDAFIQYLCQIERYKVFNIRKSHPMAVQPCEVNAIFSSSRI